MRAQRGPVEMEAAAAADPSAQESLAGFIVSLVESFKKDFLFLYKLETRSLFYVYLACYALPLQSDFNQWMDSLDEFLS